MVYSNEPLSRVGARFNAGRTFDVEDDVEFCPTLSEEEVNIYRYGMLDGPSPSPNNNFNNLTAAAQTTPPHSTTVPDYYFGSSGPGSPVSRGTGGAVLANGSTYFYTNNGGAGLVAAGGMKNMPMSVAATSTPIRRRPVDIIDPMTGSNVSSPMMNSGGYYSNVSSSSSGSNGTVYYTANASYSNGSPTRGSYNQYPVSVGGDSYGTPSRGRAW